MKDDVAFQSQQFAEQVEQRRDHYADQMQATWRQLPEGMMNAQRMQATRQNMLMAQQEHQLNMDRGAQALAMDQLRRQDAADQLQWSRELHTTDMLAINKRMAAAQADMAEMNVMKMRKELDDGVPSNVLSEEKMDSLIVSGAFAEMKNGRYETRPATPEEISAAKARSEYRRTERERIYKMQLNEQKAWRDEDRASREKIAAERLSAPNSSDNYHSFNSRLDGLTTELQMIDDRIKHGAPTTSDSATIKKWNEELAGLQQRKTVLMQRIGKLNDSYDQDGAGQPAMFDLRKNMMDSVQSMRNMVK